MRRSPISAKAMREAGWTRTDPRPWSKCRARWIGPRGFRLEHCGHPTALWPWALYDEAGFMHVGANGRAWASLADAVAYVAHGAESQPGGRPDRRRAVHVFYGGQRIS